MSSKRVDLTLDAETAQLLVQLAGSRNRQSALIRRLVHQEAQQRQIARLAELEAEAARLRAQLTTQADSPD